MSSPPPLNRRIELSTALGAVALLVGLALPAAAQQPPDRVPTTGGSMLLDAAVAGVVTLLVGGGFVALAPEYTERTTDRALEDPGETFLYGLGILVAAIVVVFLLAITIVGLVLAIPLVIVLAVVGQLGYLAAGRAVADDWGVALLFAVVVSALSNGVPVLGGLVGFVLGSVGTGAWYLDYRDGGSGSGGSDFDPSYSGGPGGSTGGDVSDEWGASESGLGAAGATHGADVDAGSEPADGDADGYPDGDAEADDPGDEWTAGFDREDRE